MCKHMTVLQMINVVHRKIYMNAEHTERREYVIIIRVVQNRAFVKILIKFIKNKKKTKIFKKICYNIKYTINNEFI